MNLFEGTEDKRKVPAMLQRILNYDIQITKKFVEVSQNITALRSLRIHSKFLEVSTIIKISLFKAFCQTFYTSSLLMNYTRKALDTLRVQYNNGFRMLMGFSRFCSASKMFAETQTNGFSAVIRNKTFSLLTRLRRSSNSILKMLAYKTDSPALRHFVSVLVSCHGIVWLAGWLSCIWLFNNKDLYQLQVNMLIALILDIVVIAVMKAFVRRRRPVPMNKLIPGNPDKYSFPSGHSSRAALVAFILICIDPIYFLFYPPLLAWVGAVAISRVLAERHYFLDVFAGLGIGVLEGLVMSLIWFSQSTAGSILATLSDEKKDGGEYHV